MEKNKNREKTFALPRPRNRLALGYDALELRRSIRDYYEGLPRSSLRTHRSSRRLDDLAKFKLIHISVTLAVIVGLGNAHAARAQEQRQRRPGGCRAIEFRCRNGECIPSENLCDGRTDCTDGSDENRQACADSGILCPDFAFRCDYGACIDGDATCNGIRDCADNSDELLPRCGNSDSTNRTCGVNQFRCANGQCTSETAICDGIVDCIDGSDETTTLCKAINCPPFTFRCAYGACIAQKLKCNGVQNCRDGSDEDPNLCRDIIVTRPTPPQPRPPTPTPTRPAQGTCPSPPQPANGRWQMHKSQCQGNEHCSNSNEHLPGSSIAFNCNEGYKLRGSRVAYCGLDEEWSSKPSCVEIRCKSLSTASTVATCTYNNAWTSCEVPVLPNTLAKVGCRNSYHNDANVLSSQRRENVRCNSQGRWEPEPIKCVPECGLIRLDSKPLVVNGTRPNLPEFPWHATLYTARNAQDRNKKFLCGASIIQSNLLITAAHCVYDEAYHRVMDPSTFFIMTGNTFRDYDHPYNPFAKKANVTDIYVNCNYLGLEGNYAGDIAILRIDTHFTFSSLLMPVCIDDTQNSDLAVLEVGKVGKVAGFGRTGPTASQASSQILQSLTVPYVSLSECHAASSQSNSGKFITLDKFCAGYTNGSSVCDGDSGGGLVFNTGGLFYLRGVVSTGIGLTLAGGTRSCDSNTYALYTRISSHIEWIQDVLLKVEIYGSYPECSTRSAPRS